MPLLEREVRRLATSFSGTAGIYVENLGTGAGAAWNAKATFPAASALKLAIAVTALARTEGTPVRGSGLDVLMRQMLIVSDNGAANGVERWFAGSTHAGSAAVNATMRSLGLYDTEMYGGYELEALGTPPRALASAIPLRVTSQPYWGRGKKTSAFDLARLARAVWLASGGLGPLHTRSARVHANGCPLPAVPARARSRSRQGRPRDPPYPRRCRSAQGWLDRSGASRQRRSSSGRAVSTWSL